MNASARDFFGVGRTFLDSANHSMFPYSKECYATCRACRSPPCRHSMTPPKPTNPTAAPAGPENELRAGSSQHAGKIAARSAVYTAGTVLVRVIGFALVLVYTRFLTPSEYGMLALAEAIAAVFSILSWAMQGAVQRKYFDFRDAEHAMESGFLASTVALIGVTFILVLALGIGAVPVVLRRTSPSFAADFVPYLVLATITVAANQITEMQLLLYSLEHRVRQYLWLSLVFSLLTSALTVVAVIGLHWGGRGLLLGKLVASLAVAAFVLYDWRRWLRRPAASIVKSLTLIAATLVPFQITSLGLNAADRLILKAFRPVSEVGIYSIAYTIGMAMALLSLSVFQAWSPDFYRMAAANEGRPTGSMASISTTILAGLIAVGTVGVAISPPFIIEFLDVRYQAAAGIVPIVIAALVLHTFFVMLQLGIRQQNRFSIIVWVSATAFVVNIGINFALIPHFGMYGAAWATLIAYGVEAVICTIAAQRVYPMPIGWRRLVFALVVLACALTTAIAPVSHRNLWSLLPLSAAVLMSWKDMARIAKSWLRRRSAATEATESA